MKYRVLSVIFFFVLTAVFAQEAAPATQDGFDARLELGVEPYFYETQYQTNGFGAEGMAEGYYRLGPFCLGLSYDVTLILLYGGTPWMGAISAPGDAQYRFTEGWMMTMRLDVCFGFCFSENFNVEGGLGAAMYESGLTASCLDPWTGQGYSREVSQFCVGFSAFLDIGIGFGSDAFDISLINKIDVLPDVVYYGGIRGNFRLLDGMLTPFFELGARVWNQNRAVSDPDLATVCIGCKVGVSLQFSPVRRKDGPTAPVSDSPG